MRRILTEPGVAKICRFGLGNILNWEILLAEIDKSLGCLEKKQKKTPGIFCAKKKKKRKKRRMLVSYWKSFIINQT